MGERTSDATSSLPELVSVIVAAPDTDKDPLNREKLWWEIQRTTCSKTDYDFYIKLIKSQLLLLQRTAQQTIESYKETKLPKDIAQYQQHLDNIFSDDHVSATALNVKSLQCAVLFSIMEGVDIKVGTFGAPDFLNYAINTIKNWDNYDKFIKNNALSSIPGDVGDYLVIEEPTGTTSCVPSFKKKALIVLLGEMTLYELVSSMANDVYLIGLPTKSTIADGSIMAPVSFLLHDLDHMKYRVEIDDTIIHEVNLLIRHFLKHIKDIEIKTRDTYLMFLFLIIHEKNYDIKLLKTLRIVGIVDPGRFLDKNDLGGFLPTDHEFKTREDVNKWLQSEWSIFSKEWNEQIISRKEEILATAAASNWGSNVGEKNFSEETGRNAERYKPRPEPSGGNSSASSGGSRRRPGRRSRSKTQKRQRQQRRQRQQTRKHSLNLFKRNKE
jgi:hypothetical protein